MKLFNGDTIWLDRLDSLHLAQAGIYEAPETYFIQSFLKPDHVAADVGANIGYHARLMARQCRKVHCFEPEPSNFTILQKNALPNMELHQKAVGAYAGKVGLHICKENSGMHRVYPSKWCGESIEVEMTTLGTLDHIDFMKMDIEGSEAGALEGLGKHRPTIIMEYHEPSIREYGTDPLPLLKEMGYRTSKLGGKSLLCQPT